MNKVYFGMIAILACAAVCLGQAGQSTTATKSDRVMLASGTTMSAELQKTLDVGNTKVGDQITLKVTKSITQNGQVIVPKGSNLVGRVTEVQKRTKETSVSRIGMIFDRIEGKNFSAPISASIISITGAAAGGSAGDAVTSDVSGSSMTSANASRTSTSGGLLGGVGGTVGGLVGTTTQTVGAVTDTVGGTVHSTTGGAGRTLSGIQISTSASGSANSSTVISSPNKTLRVEKGASINLRVDSRR